MHNVGTSFDKWLANIVRGAYVLGTFFGWYGLFTGSTINNPVVTYIMGISLAAAVVLHEWLQLRRALLYRNRSVRSTNDAKVRAHFAHLFKVNFVLGCIILAFGGFMLYNHFSIVNGGASIIPPNAAAIIEAIILPIFAGISTFLTDVEDDPNAMLAKHAYSMTQTVVNLGSQQWSKRVQNAVQNGHPLAPIAIALMENAGDVDGAARVRIIENGLRETEQNDVSKSAQLYVSPAQESTALAAPSMYNENVQGKKRPKSSSPSAHRGGQKGVQNGHQTGTRKARNVVSISPRMKAKKFILKNPNATDAEVMRGAKVSRGTVRAARNELQPVLTLAEG